MIGYIDPTKKAFTEFTNAEAMSESSCQVAVHT
jgi:hypothetical protein